MNVYGPGNPDRERRSRLSARTIRDLDPDLVALQEVPVDAPEVTERFVGPGFHVTHFSQSSEDGVCGTLGTRWPHRLVAELDLRITQRSHHTPPWCATAIVELETPVGTVVVAHHKPTWPFPFELERAQQAVLAARAIEDHIGSRDVHAVVLGDFDATPDSASMSFWRGRRPAEGVSVCYKTRGSTPIPATRDTRSSWRTRWSATGRWRPR